ncbi:MAG: phage head closure protein [Anaerolineaceae bacterium]|nr:phage head closure protein [Anaerolineaceae bacterium]
MILNGRVFNPGEMRTTITLENRSVSTETGGFKSPTWTPIVCVRAKWINAHGSEVWAADAVQAQQPATVTMRYQAGFDSTCAVTKDEKRFEVIGSVDDIENRHEYMQFKVRLMRNG